MVELASVCVCVCVCLYVFVCWRSEGMDVTAERILLKLKKKKSVWIPSVCKKSLDVIRDGRTHTHTHTHTHMHTHTHTFMLCRVHEEWTFTGEMTDSWVSSAAVTASRHVSFVQLSFAFTCTMQISSKPGDPQHVGGRRCLAQGAFQQSSCSPAWTRALHWIRQRVPEEKIPDSIDTESGFLVFFSLFFVSCYQKPEGHQKKKSTWKRSAALQQEMLRVLEACPTTNSHMETPEKNIQMLKYVLQPGLITDCRICRLLSQTHRDPLVTLKLKREVDETGSTASPDRFYRRINRQVELEFTQEANVHAPRETKHQWSSPKPDRTNCCFTPTVQMLQGSCERNLEVWRCSSVISQRVGCWCLTDRGCMQDTCLKPLDIKDTSGLVRATLTVTETGCL